MDNKAFDFQRIARGYAERPFLHKGVIDKFREEITINTFEQGLDVGCGAGLSTKALKTISNHVTGTDISQEMIMVAKEVCTSRDIDFFVCKAEEVPKKNMGYDIATACGVIQWVDQKKFLHNLYQIMSENGVLLIYDFYIADRMKNKEHYSEWWYNQYLENFPKPKRNDQIWTSEEVKQEGFSMIKQEKYDLEYLFNLESFVDFMLIQSNVNAQIEGNGRNIDEVKQWFVNTLTPIFDGESRTLFFNAYSWYLKKE